MSEEIGNSANELLKRLFDESFPELPCPRCQNHTYFVISPLLNFLISRGMDPRESPVVGAQLFNLYDQYPNKIDTDWNTLIQERITDPSYYADFVCRKCGFTERHFLPIMMAAHKPISGATSD